MQQTVSERTLSRLWAITALAIIVLIVSTAALAFEARRVSARASIEAIIVSRGPSVYLREDPDGTSKIVATLHKGDEVSVVDSLEWNGVLWYEVQTSNIRGYISASQVRLR